ncbi:hybrid sensor histidine kinase/response regulator [Pseudanabaena sp. SR411]|uniref:PAS domain S-box protein n=1 Tax=Pseudanabaena sp. SR411 TaxID=1980935 RepID=UPI000B994BAB|nr:PAS domain S-box protein [Pseudanabaena sp. SR411]OYQ66570.1 hybrid sensor histidine kinase/response regulator [Pseudanabaena sp. SR411]
MNRHISQISGVLVIVIALTVMLGWQFDISLLKSGLPFINVSMKANAAICFLFAGISLMLLLRQRSARSHYRVSQGLAGAIVAIGLLTLIEYCFGWDLHIDQLLFRDVVSSKTPYAGRMGVNTAVNFVLMGIALLLLGRNCQRNTWWAQICGSIAALISLLALFGQIFNVGVLASLGALATIQAVNSILSFFILYVGILYLRPKEGLMQTLTSPLVGGEIARRLLPWAIILPIILELSSFYGQKIGWYNPEFGYALRLTILVFTFSILIWVTARFLNQVDRKRQQAEKELKKLNETLEILVAERTKSLRTSEDQFRHAFEDASIGMAIISLDGHWIKVNSALCQIIGYSPEELFTLTFQDITYSDDLDIDLRYVKQLLAGEISTYQLEKRYLHKQGHIVWILLNVSLIKDTQGNPLHFISQIQNVSARKEAQKTLELQSIIMNNMAGGVCLVKATDLTIGYTNPKFDAMFGYEDGELAGQPVGVINYVDTEVTPDATVEDIVTQLDRDGEAKYEVHNKKKDGTLFWCRVHTSRFEHPEYGTVYVAVQEDVTELKLSEKALQTTAHRLDFLLNYSPVVIFSSKPDGDYGATFISENIKEVMGYDPKAFLEESEFWINHLHPDDVDPVLNGLTNLFAEDLHFQEFRLLHADGNYRWILEQLRIIRDHAGNPIEILGYLIDISDRKQVELELQKAKEAAEVANLAKSMFLSNMSHELRTPLNAILGFTELMSYDLSLSPEHQEDLAIVNRSGKHLLELINDILDLSKIESGQMKLNPSDFDLENLLISIEELFQVQAQSKELKLIVDRDRNLPKFVHTDQKKLYQTLVNLLGNAIKFTKQGSVTLRVRLLGIPILKQAQLLFEVEDTGVGIASKDIDSLFKAFVQAQAGNQLNQGTGLGLAISQRFIQLMGSQIRVQSTLNQGSTFSFELGVQLPQAAILTSEPLNQRVISLASGQPTYRILIVEDLADNRRLLVELLTAIGFEVREATHGIEALSLWESWSPHLILMDLRMPIMDGYTATKRIREKPQSQDTVIIALTASVFDEERDQVLMAGCNDFIGKPFQPKELFDKIAQHLGVQYIYETREKAATQPSVKTLSVEDLSAMPPQWLEQMYQAAYYLDTEVMNELIAQIPESNARLSKALIATINNFNSDRIMELIRPLLPNLG